MNDQRPTSLSGASALTAVISSPHYQRTARKPPLTPSSLPFVLWWQHPRPAAEAADLATMLITLLQGAHVMARATGTVQPFDQAAGIAAALCRDRYGGA